MLHDWQTTQHARLRQKDLQREADQHRLAQAVYQTPRGRIVRIYGPALYRIGSAMTTVGQRLQTTYGDSVRLRLDSAE